MNVRAVDKDSEGDLVTGRPSSRRRHERREADPTIRRNFVLRMMAIGLAVQKDNYPDDLAESLLVQVETHAAAAERERLQRAAEKARADGLYTDQEWGAIGALFYVESIRKVESP